jgi:hypothetical protein
MDQALFSELLKIIPPAPGAKPENEPTLEARLIQIPQRADTVPAMAEPE